MLQCASHLHIILLNMLGDLTELLRRASQGDQSAAARSMVALEDELRRLASIHMKRERGNHTLQTTAVMNEAVIRLLGAGGMQWNNRQHFLSVASRVMRRLLVDYARAAMAQKREATVVSLELAKLAGDLPISTHVLDIHRALEEFTKIAPRQAELVELRFFGGLSLDEAAKVLGVSPRLADKDWVLAKAWLRGRLSEYKSQTRRTSHNNLFK